MKHHTRILFFERYVSMLTYPILAYTYPQAMHRAMAGNEHEAEIGKKHPFW